MSGLSEEERQALTQQVMQELEEEHQERLDELAERKERAKNRAKERARRKREAEEAKLREQLREKFYEEKGYKLYLDRSGKKSWLPKEEYEWRMRRRSKSARHEHGFFTKQHQSLMLYGATVVLAVLVGLFLLR